MTNAATTDAPPSGAPDEITLVLHGDTLTATLTADLAVIGWSARELAKRLECHPNTVLQWTQGVAQPPWPLVVWVAELAAVHRSHPPPPWRRPRFPLPEQFPRPTLQPGAALGHRWIRPVRTVIPTGPGGAAPRFVAAIRKLRLVAEKRRLKRERKALGRREAKGLPMD